MQTPTDHFTHINRILQSNNGNMHPSKHSGVSSISKYSNNVPNSSNVKHSNICKYSLYNHLYRQYE